MLTSVVVPTYIASERQEALHKHLKPAIESILQFSSDIELIIVSNGSSEETNLYLLELSKNLDNLTVIINKNKLGFARATNLGIKASRGDFVVLFNDDATLLNQDINKWLVMLQEPLKDSRTVISGPLDNKFAGRRFLIGFCLMVKKSFFDSYGCLDESFYPGWGEDIDLCWRAEKYGLKFAMVGETNNIIHDQKMIVGSFPIYHKGEATFDFYPELSKQSEPLKNIILDRMRSGFYSPFDHYRVDKTT